MNERRETGPPKGHVAAGTCTDFGPLRQQLVESLAERGVFREPWLREVFETVYRHWFVPDRVWTWRSERWWPVNRHDDEPK